jgi:hypothetical protein
MAIRRAASPAAAGAGGAAVPHDLCRQADQEHHVSQKGAGALKAALDEIWEHCGRDQAKVDAAACRITTAPTTRA